jgi:hypothetical protein
LAEPLDVPSHMILSPEQLLARAEELNPLEVIFLGVSEMGEMGPGKMAGIMQAFQDAATSDCDCGPCVTLREMVRGFLSG